MGDRGNIAVIGRDTRDRIKKLGWAVEKAIFTPSRKMRRAK